MQHHTLGLDVGGTKIATVVLDQNGTVLSHSKVPTAGHGPAVVHQILDLVSKALTEHEPVGIGIAVPGNVDPTTGTVICAPNIGWNSVDLRASLARAVPSSVQVTVENDANAATWAEYRYGGHTDANSFAMVTVGTGLGGGFVINGQLLRGANGGAGEIGHLPLVQEGDPCTCGARGCWERYASGTALRRAAQASGWTGPHASQAVLHEADSNPEAHALVLGIASHLAHGIELMTSALDPNTVVLGGGLGTDPRFLAAAREALAARTITPPRSRPALKSATLGPLAGAIGAADLAATHGS
jgi:glucokinase